MSPVAEQVLFQIFDDQLETASQFVLSVSGGPDSVALAKAFAELSPFFSWKVFVFHFDFGLRGKESRKDAEFVKNLSNQLGFTCFISELHFSKKKFNQEIGRRQRMQRAAAILPNAIWVEAHHKDDQIENFLFRLFRGTGPEGLVGMHPLSERAGKKVFRPFLSLQKKDLLEYLKKDKQEFRLDSSNESVDYHRNWIRNCLIPEIKNEFPQVVNQIEKTRKLLALDKDFLESELDKKFDILSKEIDRKSFREFPESLQLKALRLWLWTHYRIRVGFEALLELRAIILCEEGGFWNSPRGGVFRCNAETGAFICVHLPKAANTGDFL